MRKEKNESRIKNLSDMCRVCKNSKSNRRFNSSNMRSQLLEPFEYIQCSSCGSVSILEIPHNLSKFYENYYSFGEVTDNESWMRKISKKLVAKNMNYLKFITDLFLDTSSDLALKSINFQRLHNQSDILDVGCGTGQLVFELKNLGFKNVCGIDPYLDQDIRHYNNAIVYKKKLDDFQHQCDLIMFHHVFEHLDDQMSILMQTRKLLKREGQLLIRIPNVDSYAFRKYQKYWYGLQPPLHLALPSMQAMKDLTTKAGLKIINIQGENLLEFWYHSIAYSLNIWDYHKYGIRTHMQELSLKSLPTLITRDERRWLQRLNKKISKHPSLCDWVAYHIVKD